MKFLRVSFSGEKIDIIVGNSDTFGPISDLYLRVSSSTIGICWSHTLVIPGIRPSPSGEISECVIGIIMLNRIITQILIKQKLDQLRNRFAMTSSNSQPRAM